MVRVMRASGLCGQGFQALGKRATEMLLSAVRARMSQVSGCKERGHTPSEMMEQTNAVKLQADGSKEAQSLFNFTNIGETKGKAATLVLFQAMAGV